MFHNFMWGCGMWFGWIFWVAIIAIIIWLLVNRSNRYSNWNRINQNFESPLDILKKRYAKGEITKEQYDQMKKDLE